MLREISGAVGRLEVLLDEPPARFGSNDYRHSREGRSDGIRAAVILTHPHPQHGGTMHTKAVFQAAKALARIGCGVLRFNFRGVGLSQGTFDNAVGEQDDCRAAIDFMVRRYPDAAVWVGGMSFGAYVATTVGATHPRVSTLLGIAMPIGRFDFSAVQESTKPKFFVHAERDELCPLRQMRAFYATAAEPKELVVIDGANHVFDGKTAEIGDAMEDLFADWPESSVSGARRR